MRLIIAGGRTFNNYEKIKLEVMNFLIELAKDDKIVTTIVSGKAIGVDRLGERFARELSLNVDPFPADWKNIDVEPCVIGKNKYGEYNKLAGHNRNEEMAKHSDCLIAFWDGNSTGTKDMIDRANKYNLIIKIINI